MNQSKTDIIPLAVTEDEIKKAFEKISGLINFTFDEYPFHKPGDTLRGPVHLSARFFSELFAEVLLNPQETSLYFSKFVLGALEAEHFIEKYEDVNTIGRYTPNGWVTPNFLVQYELLSVEAKERLFKLEKNGNPNIERLFLNYQMALRKCDEKNEFERMRKVESSPRIGKSGRMITGGHAIGAGTRRRIYAEDNYECVYCSVKVESKPDDRGIKNTLDHVIPGVRKKENLVTACLSCNSEKNNRTPEEAGMTPKYGRFKAKSYDESIYQSLLQPTTKN